MAVFFLLLLQLFRAGIFSGVVLGLIASLILLKMLCLRALGGVLGAAALEPAPPKETLEPLVGRRPSSPAAPKSVESALAPRLPVPNRLVRFEFNVSPLVALDDGAAAAFSRDSFRAAAPEDGPTVVAFGLEEEEVLAALGAFAPTTLPVVPVAVFFVPLVAVGRFRLLLLLFLSCTAGGVDTPELLVFLLLSFLVTEAAAPAPAPATAAPVAAAPVLAAVPFVAGAGAAEGAAGASAGAGFADTVCVSGAGFAAATGAAAGAFAGCCAGAFCTGAGATGAVVFFSCTMGAFTCAGCGAGAASGDLFSERAARDS